MRADKQPRFRQPSTWRLGARFQPLEPRRLLAAMFDPNFGGGDGFNLLPTPWNFADINDEGTAVVNWVHPQQIRTLGDGYFIHGLHNERADDGTASGELLDATTIHGLVTGSGAPATNLSGDDNDDGVALYPLQELNGGVQFNPNLYTHLVPLPNGDLLVSGAEIPDDQDRAITRLNPDGSENSSFGVHLDQGSVIGMGLLRPNVGVLMTSNSSVRELRLFDTGTGAFIGDPVKPFGDWLSGGVIFGHTWLEVGRDGAVYVATLTKDLDGSADPDSQSGFLVTRLTYDGTALAFDEDFGSASLPGQDTPAAYFTSDQPPSNAFDLIGATSDGRVWLRVLDPDTGNLAEAFSLLTPQGEIDPAFGDAGTVVVDFPGAGGFPVFDAPHLDPGQPRFFVRGDGSLVGVMGMPEDAFPSDEFRLGIYGLLPDGSFDPRIAEAGSAHGQGRTIVSVDAAPEGAVLIPSYAAAALDEAERLVIVSQAGFEEGTSDSEIPVNLLVGRILLNAPEVEIVVREDGLRVLEITGTSGDDTIYVRPAANFMLNVLTASVGGEEALIGEFFEGDIDRVELNGGGGDDELAIPFGESFEGLITVRGGSGDDYVWGSGHYARVFGEEGNDRMLFGSGDQLLFGGPGNDTLGGGIGAGRDALWGDEGDDQLYGGDDGDFLDGGEGNDSLSGESGADTLVGGFGSDVLDGGTDNPDDTDDRRERDLVSYAAFPNQVSVDLAAGTATHPGLPLNPGETPAAEADQLIDIEDVLGGSGDDLLAGDDGRNRLFGGAGSDTLRGLAGKDTLFAGAGDDLLEGGDDTDWLFGPLATSSAGRARLVGGGGFDWGISNEDEERDSLERWFTSVDGFVNSIT